MKGEGTDDVQMLKDKRPDIARFEHAVCVGSQHYGFLRGETSAIGLKLAEEGNDLLPVAILLLFSLVWDEAAVGFRGEIPAIEGRMVAIASP